MNWSDRVRILARVGALAVAALVLPAGVRAQSAPAEPSVPKEEGGVFRMGNSPSLRLGDHLRVDLHARVQADVRLRDESGNTGERFAWGNRRVGIDGELFDRLDFQIERELAVDAPWRDVFADLRLHRALRVRAGHFKVPFSMERTTSAEGFHGTSVHFDDDDLLSSEDFYVNGRRRQIGIEGRWTGGRLTIVCACHEYAPLPASARMFGAPTMRIASGRRPSIEMIATLPGVAAERTSGGPGGWADGARGFAPQPVRNRPQDRSAASRFVRGLHRQSSRLRQADTLRVEQENDHLVPARDRSHTERKSAGRLI